MSDPNHEEQAQKLDHFHDKHSPLQRPDWLKSESSEQEMSSSEERRNQRFFQNTITALKDIHERGLQLPQDERYAAAYGILRGYFESLLTNFAEAFSEQQLAEIRIVLDQLRKLVIEDEHLDEATKSKLDELAQALRESEEGQ